VPPEIRAKLFKSDSVTVTFAILTHSCHTPENKSGGVPRDGTNALLRAQLQASQATLRAKDLEQKLHKQNRTSSQTFAAVAATKLVAASSQLTSQSTSTPTRAQRPDPLDFIEQMAALFAKFASPQLV
jgi:hypothetical protein